jgi:hypothetical protein
MTDSQRIRKRSTGFQPVLWTGHPAWWPFERRQDVCSTNSQDGCITQKEGK